MFATCNLCLENCKSTSWCACVLGKMSTKRFFPSIYISVVHFSSSSPPDDDVSNEVPFFYTFMMTEFCLTKLLLVFFSRRKMRSIIRTSPCLSPFCIQKHVHPSFALCSVQFQSYILVHAFLFFIVRYFNTNRTIRRYTTLKCFRIDLVELT